MLTDTIFDKTIMLAVPLKVYESAKYEHRGGSIFDGKLDSFDALDEAWSQRMDARQPEGQRSTYRNAICRETRTHRSGFKAESFPTTAIFRLTRIWGRVRKTRLMCSSRRFRTHSYLATYVTALDLCLQGIISPSTLGIDVKKLDNAEAQREKEKTTLYTRNAIIDALQKQFRS